MRLNISDDLIDNIRFRLLRWGSENYRDFPWRRTTDPYLVLVSEVMLHRTNAEQVIDVYNRFVTLFPTVDKLAEAPLSQLVEELRKLGLRWRVLKLKEMAIKILDQYDGRVPDDKESLMSLPGVGPYIASAVLCVAFNKKEPLLDTNLVRIIGRIFGLMVTDSSRRDKIFLQIMSLLLPEDKPSKVLYSMLDHASAVCVKKTLPRCSLCPINNQCRYFRTGNPCL